MESQKALKGQEVALRNELLATSRALFEAEKANQEVGKLRGMTSCGRPQSLCVCPWDGCLPADGCCQAVGLHE